MNDQVSIPLGGVLRVIYFLALASALVAFVTSAVGNIYEGPATDEESGGAFPSGVIFPVAAADNEQRDYDRNLGVIYSLLGSALMAFGVAALPRAQNGARAGVLGGGAIVFYVGLASAGSGANDWLLAVWSLVGLLTLLAVLRFLDEGSDWANATVGRLRGRAG